MLPPLRYKYHRSQVLTRCYWHSLRYKYYKRLCYRLTLLRFVTLFPLRSSSLLQSGSKAGAKLLQAGSRRAWQERLGVRRWFDGLTDYALLPAFSELAVGEGYADSLEVEFAPSPSRGFQAFKQFCCNEFVGCFEHVCAGFSSEGVSPVCRHWNSV